MDYPTHITRYHPNSPATIRTYNNGKAYVSPRHPNNPLSRARGMKYE